MSWWERLLRGLGINPTQLRWRIHRYQERSKRLAQDLENRRRSLTYKHKVCDRCGSPLDAKEKTCPRCGQRQAGALMGRLARVWRLLIPQGTYTYSAVLVVLCVAFYLAMMMQSGGTAALGRTIDPRVIIRFGAWTVPLVAQGEVWRLVTPIFLHFDALHIIFNCLWLIQLGPLVESTYGRSRFLAIWLASGVVGFAATVAYRWQAWQWVQAPGAGASGVVFGLIAVALVAGFIKRVPGADAYRGGLVKWAIYALIFSLLPQMDLVAHLGGALGGGACALVLAHQGQARRVSDRVWFWVEILLWVVVGLCFSLVVLNPRP